MKNLDKVQRLLLVQQLPVIFAASTAEQQPCYVLKVHICTIFVPKNAAASIGTAVGRFLDVRMSFFKEIKKHIFLFVIFE